MSRKKRTNKAAPRSIEPATPAREIAAPRSHSSASLLVPVPLLAMFAAAFIVRLGVSAELGQTALFRNAQLDSREYLSWAQRIAIGNFSWPVPPAHGPGYPFLLGALLAMFNGSVPAVRLVQAALGAVTCLLAARLSGKLFGKNAELATGLFLALYGPLVLTDVSILSEGLLLFLLCSTFLILSGRVESRPRLFAGGFLLGAAAIVRPTALLFAPPLLLWVAWRSGWNRRALLGAGLLIAGCLVPVLPVAVANARSTPRPVLIQGNGGLNFYIGNSPGGGGVPSVRPGEAWDQLEGEPARKGFALPADQDRYFYAKTFREIASSPAAWAGLLATKALWTLQADEIRDTFSYGFFQGLSAILRFLPGFGLIFPFAVAGLVFTAYSRARPVLLWIWLATALATCVLLVVASRYRLPAVPAAAVLAGAGVAALIRRDGALRGRRGAAILAAGAAAVVCHLRVHEPSHRFSEEWSASGTSWNQEKERGAALRDFDRALALDEGYAPARVGRGVALLNLGRLDQAEAELRRAVALEPKSRVAVTELGLALERLNRPAEAEAQYRAALALDPKDLSTRRTLGDNLLRQGRAAEAVTLLREVILRAPGHAPTRLALARALGAAGRAAEAIAEAREATRLDSERSEAWVTLAMLALDTGDLGQADAALREAERTGAAGRDTSLGRALLYRAERLPDRVDRELRPLVRSDPGFRPAVELFLENARQRGAEREALDFLRERAHRPS